MRDFLNKRKKREVLNREFSTWKSANARVPQGSYLVIVFLYIYDLTQGHSSWFSVIHDIQTSANNLNKDLERISKWTTQ